MSAAPPQQSDAVAKAYPLASLLFFASGFTGLAYEVVWFKHFAHVWGSSTLATAAVVGSFLLGLGIGAQIVGRIADRVATPLLWYGVSEAVIGVLALTIPFELQLLRSLSAALYPALAGQPLLHYFARLGLTFLVIGPPTILMGGTLPLMVRQFTTAATGLRRSTGWLYAVNTIGAATGCYVCGFHLLASFGLGGSNTITALANLAIGAGAVLLARSLAAAPATTREERVEEDPFAAREARVTSLVARSRLLLWTTAVLTGFAALVLQIVWVRQLVLVLGGTTYAFTAVLFVVLVGIGLGSLCFRVWAGTAMRLDLLPAIALPVLIVATVLGQALLEPLTTWVAGILNQRASQGYNAYVCVTASAVLELVPAIVMGLLFPYLVHVTRHRAEHAGEAVGRIYALNTLGTILGASLTSAILIPAVGSAGTVQVALVVYAVAFLLLFPLQSARERPRARPIALVACAALVAFALLAVPRPEPRVTNAGGYVYGTRMIRTVSENDEVLMFEEGRMANVLVTRGDGDVYLRVDGKVDATSGGDMGTQLGLAYYPRFFRPGARDVCVIGYGSGSTAGASCLFPGTNVTCCEIEPAVYEASRFFRHVNHDPPTQPNFRIVLDDGRNFLQGTQQEFDLIISEPSNPWMPGIANLFTREFYESAKAKLRPGGMIAQWIQVYDFKLSEYALIVRTIADVFPHTALLRLHDRDTILLASTEPIEASSALADEAQRLVSSVPAVRSDLSRAFGSADVRRLLIERWFLDGEGLERLVARDRSGRGLNTDVNLRLEFDAPLRLFVQRDPRVPPEVDLDIVSASSPEWFAELYAALEAGPAQVEALWTPLGVYRDRGHGANAQAVLEFAWRAAPADPGFVAERLFVELAGSPGPSEEQHAALERLPPDVVVRVGYRLWQAQSHAAAAAVFERLVQRTPRSWENWANLGVNLQALGRMQEAETAFRKALEIDPTRPELQQLFRNFQDARK